MFLLCFFFVFIFVSSCFGRRICVVNVQVGPGKVLTPQAGNPWAAGHAPIGFFRHVSTKPRSSQSLQQQSSVKSLAILSQQWSTSSFSVQILRTCKRFRGSSLVPSTTARSVLLADVTRGRHGEVVDEPLLPHGQRLFMKARTQAEIGLRE